MKQIDEYKKLPLLGAQVSSFVFTPYEKIVLGLSVIHPDIKKIDTCELQFNRIHNLLMAVEIFDFLGEIEKFLVSCNPDFLKQKTEDKEYPYEQLCSLCFFSIITKKGEIDVIAEDFKFSVIRRSQIMGACS